MQKGCVGNTTSKFADAGRLSMRKLILMVAVVIALPFIGAPVGLRAEDKPTAPTLTIQESSIEVSWESSLSGVTWEVWYWTEAGGWIRLDDGSLAETTIKHEGPTAGTIYWYTYRSIGDETGAWSEYAEITMSVAGPIATATLAAAATTTPTATATETATATTASSTFPAPTLTISGSSIEVSWGSTLTGVTWEALYWAESEGWVRLDDGSLAETTITHESPTAGTHYWYTYRSIGNETSAWSEYADITMTGAAATATLAAATIVPTATTTATATLAAATIVPTATATPTATASNTFSAPTLTAVLEGEDIVVRWTEVVGATEYNIWCLCSMKKWEDFWHRDGTEARLTARPNVNYVFKVRAYNSAGEATDFSEEINLNTPAVIATNTPVPMPTMTPTATAVPESDYEIWLPGITIAAESSCSYWNWYSYGFGRASVEAATLRERIYQAMNYRYYDPYTTEYFGSFDEMRINHVVDIRQAHISGMCSRMEHAGTFVYDVENAVLTDRRNRYDHSDHYDLTGWLPDNNQCWYVNQVVKVKRKYGLTMDEDEADVAVSILSECTSTEMYFSNNPTPTPTPDTSPLGLYDDNNDGTISCAEARAHGIAPVHSVHPAYPYMSDPDGNGIACE